MAAQSIALLIFSLNEVDGMKAVLPRIPKNCLDQILVIDGNSTDGSIEYARSQGFDVMIQKEKGAIAAIKEAFATVKTSHVITFSPDNNMIPEKLPELVEKMKQGYDMVVVSRYLNGSKSYDDNFISGFGNWMFTTMVNVLFKGSYTDVLGFYRGYRRDLIKDLDIDMKSSLNTQLAIRCQKKGLKVVEIPGDEPKRIGGVTKRSIVRHGWAELTTILSECFQK